jgi:hypothetical protein
VTAGLVAFVIYLALRGRPPAPPPAPAIKPVPPPTTAIKLAPPPTPPAPWPAELQEELEAARKTVKLLVDEDRKVRRELPRRMQEAEEEADRRFGKDSLVARLTKSEAHDEFRRRKLVWREAMNKKMVELAVDLVKLRERYGMQDQKLAEEVTKILEGLKPLGEPW